MSNYKVEILVNGRPIRQFQHRDGVFVEGRRGSKFGIKVTNTSWQPVEAVPAVDGLSTMDGKLCGPDSSGYLIPAYGSIVIPGWRLDNDKVAQFIFGDRERSYAVQTGQGGQNAGAIGLMFFKEKAVTTNFPIADWYRPIQTWSSSGGDIFSSNAVFGSNASTHTATEPASISRESNDENHTFNLGVEFGQEQNHKVSLVDFERNTPNHPDEVITIFYDDRQGLEARGIRVVRKKTRKTKYLPNAFPGYKPGCTPPPGWKNKRVKPL